MIVDSGLHPKKAGRLAAPDLRPLQGVKLDLIIITHCHLDHIGSLPLLMRANPDTPVIMTLPSRMLIERMLHNSANVMVREREEKGITEYPLFSPTTKSIGRRRMFPRRSAIPRNFRVHVMRSNSLFIPRVTSPARRESIVHKHRRIFFTGDVLFTTQRILDGANCRQVLSTPW